MPHQVDLDRRVLVQVRLKATHRGARSDPTYRRHSVSLPYGAGLGFVKSCPEFKCIAQNVFMRMSVETKRLFGRLGPPYELQYSLLASAARRSLSYLSAKRASGTPR